MSLSLQTGIQLHLSSPQTHQGLQYQVLEIELTRKDRLVTPQDLEDLVLPAGIDTTGGIVISGRAPIWLYTYLVHELHPTAWVACYDPRLGAIVVSTHSRLTRIGQVLPLDLKPCDGSISTSLCPTLMVVGPPDSGKSVLSHALFQTLLTHTPDIYLQRAQWDGEGNWILELGDQATEAEREAFKLAYKGELTDEFFPYQAQAILNLRRQKRLVIVDVGGMVQPEKLPLLEACSHYLIISSKPEAIDQWHEFCCDRGNLKPVAVIHSTLESREQIHSQKPFLEITSGPWLHGQTVTVPPVLATHIRQVLLGGSA